MTETLATRPAHPITLDSPEGRWKMAQRLLQSGFLPAAIDTIPKAFAVIQTGYELRLGPMQSIRSIHVVDKKPGLAAELMLALCYRDIPGFCFEMLESTDKIARGRARRNPDDAWFELTVTWDEMAAVKIDRERKKSLVEKESWKNYPRAMISARLIAAICRVKGPDATAGMHTPDELGATVTIRDDGSEEVIEVPATDPTPAPAATQKAELTPEQKKIAIDLHVEEINDCASLEALAAWLAEKAENVGKVYPDDVVQTIRKRFEERKAVIEKAFGKGGV